MSKLHIGIESAFISNTAITVNMCGYFPFNFNPSSLLGGRFNIHDNNMINCAPDAMLMCASAVLVAFGGCSQVGNLYD